MLCEVCHKNEANVHIKKIINGEKKELHVCEKCAKEVEGLDINSDIGFISPFSFQNILSGIMDYIAPTHSNMQSSEFTCKNCGTTYSEFKESGLLGCSECYKNFSSMIEPVISRVQGNVVHNGKIPKESGKQIIERNKINKLKEELKRAVEAEEYEKAAKLRDELRAINPSKGDEK